MRRIGVEHGLDLGLHQVGHVLEAADQLERMEVAVERVDALGDVLGEVADALQIGGDAHGADDLAQIDRHRLAAGDGENRLLLDLLLQRVHVRVGRHHASSEVGVAAGQRLDRIAQGLGIVLQFLREELERHDPLETDVLGPVDDAHSALAELLEDMVMGDRCADHRNLGIGCIKD